VHELIQNTKVISPVLPILIHGDAAIAGQGIVYEVAQMMELSGYRAGAQYILL